MSYRSGLRERTFRGKIRDPTTYIRLGIIGAWVALGVYTDQESLRSDYHWAGILGGALVGDAIDSGIIKPVVKLVRNRK